MSTETKEKVSNNHCPFCGHEVPPDLRVELLVDALEDLSNAFCNEPEAFREPSLQKARALLDKIKENLS